MIPMMIALDWGTTSLRAYLLNAKGQTLATQSSAKGILASQDFKSTLNEICLSWVKEFGEHVMGLPCWASGMIGSQQGWKDAGYLFTPTPLPTLGSNACDISALVGRPFWIVPGIAYKNLQGEVIDVMRGEETQLLGALQLAKLAGKQPHTKYVLPGTHSKWVSVREGAVMDFRTHMTGEVFALLKQYSILGKTMAGDSDFVEEAFLRGVEASRKIQGKNLLQQIFSVRVQALFKHLAPEAQSDYLSGLLIGAEIASELDGPPATVGIIGNQALTLRYKLALAQYGCGFESVISAEGDAAARGLYEVASNAGF